MHDCGVTWQDCKVYAQGTDSWRGKIGKECVASDSAGSKSWGECMCGTKAPKKTERRVQVRQGCVVELVGACAV